MFKRLYLENKTNINQQLLKYVMRFHTQEMLAPKGRLRTATTKAPSHSKQSKGPLRLGREKENKRVNK